MRLIPTTPSSLGALACSRQGEAYSGGPHSGCLVILYTTFALFRAQGDPVLYLPLENESHMVVLWALQTLQDTASQYSLGPRAY